MKKAVAWFIPTVLAAYVIIYLILTLTGEYRASLFKAKSIWYPKTLVLKKSKSLGGDSKLEGNTGGFIYLPLILIDRTVWHRDSGVLRGVKDDLQETLDD